MGILTMYRRVPVDTPRSIRITARTLNLHRINSSEIDALCRIRWWQSWGFDPFEPVDPLQFRSQAFAERYGGDGQMTREDWARIAEQALRVGEPGYMMVPQGVIRAADEVSFERLYQNEWPPYANDRHTLNVQQQIGVLLESQWPRHTFPEPITNGESLLTRIDAAGRLQGLVIQEHDPLRNRYRINGEWVNEVDLFNHDDLPDM